MAKGSHVGIPTMSEIKLDIEADCYIRPSESSRFVVRSVSSHLALVLIRQRKLWRALCYSGMCRPRQPDQNL